MWPFLKKLFKDSAYQGPIFHKAVGNSGPSRHQNRQTVRLGQRLRRPANVLDRRTKA